MKHHIPYGRQNITEQDIEAVVETLKGDFLTQGPRIKEFEDRFSNYIGVKYSVAVSNGTAALHICTMALNVTPGQKVITTPITFAATANAIRYCGGEVVFADIDPNTYLLNVDSVRELLESKPIGFFKGIIPVDFAGLPVNLEEYKEYKLRENIGLKKNLTGVELFDYHESEIFDDEIQSFDIDVSEIEDLKIQIADMYEKYYDELIELYRC